MPIACIRTKSCVTLPVLFKGLAGEYILVAVIVGVVTAAILFYHRHIDG